MNDDDWLCRMASDSESQRVIIITKYVVPVCLFCAQRRNNKTLPDLIEGMDELDIREELFLEEDNELPDEFACFQCSNPVDLQEGFCKEVISASEAFGLQDTPPPSRGRRPSPKLRDFIRKRCCGQCAICGLSLGWNECTLDHVKPRCKGGATAAENLVVLCSACNQWKGNRDLPTQVVVSPVLLFPDKEVDSMSPGEEERAVDYIVALFHCLEDDIPLADQAQEIAKRLRIAEKKEKTH